MTPQQQSALVAADAAVVALVEAHRVLRASLTDPAPAPAPTPAPAPEPPPAPAPEPPAPPPASATGVTAQQINLARLVGIDSYFGGGRYERFENAAAVWKTDVVSVLLRGWDVSAGGSARPLATGTYTLQIDGADAASVVVAAGQVKATISVDVSALPQGYHRLDVTCPPGESCPAWYAYRAPAGEAFKWPDKVPVTTGTYGLTHPLGGDPATHVFAWVPARWAPTTLPLPAREYPAFSTVPGRQNLVQHQLVVCRPDDTDRLQVKHDGLPLTANQQAYFESDLYSKLPHLVLLDGPRGEGTTVMPTHVQVGRRGGAYVTTSWSLQHIDAAGTVKTLVGYRHKKPPTFWPEEPELDLVGDWSAIPVERRGFQGLWGFAWDARTLAVDEAAPTMPNGGVDEHPHLTGPVGFVSDYKRDRVCSITFDPRSHETPAKVAEHITGLKGPWDVVFDDGLLYVSERAGNQVRVCDATTGATVRLMPWSSPEGLFVLDGWLYVGSSALRNVERVSLGPDSLPPQLVCTVPWNDNSRYVKLAVSDGTFGPRGLVGVVTWSNGGYGYPFLFSPEGKRLDTWLWSGTERKGPPWLAQHGLPSPGYPTCVGFGQGRMVCGTSQEGLMVMSKSLPTDGLTPDVTAGLRQWSERGYQLTHGHGGFGFFGLPLPWGDRPAIDAYLTACGHRP